MCTLCSCGRTTGSGVIISQLEGTECPSDQEELPLRYEIGFFAATIFDAGSPTRTSLVNNVKRDERSSMTLRMQARSTSIEYADGILLELSDLDAIRRAFLDANAVVIDSSERCPQCLPPVVPNARASVSVGPLCGGFNELLQSFPMAGVDILNEDDVNEQACQTTSLPSSYDGDCSFDSATRKRLEEVCSALVVASNHSENGNTNGDEAGTPEADLLNADNLGSFWPEGESCLYLCEYGDAQSQKSIQYGDWISGVLVLHVADMQQLIFTGCSRNYGTVMAAFRYRIRRSRNGQPFS